MERDIRRGYLEIDFPAEPFDSPIRLLARSAVLFAKNLGPLTAVTVAAVLPGKLLLQFFCYVLDIAPDGFAAYIVMDAGDLLFGALAVPAAIFLLVASLRGAKPAGVAESLRWGRFLWRKMLWNMFKVEITVALWTLLLLIPGILAMVRLSLTNAVVGVDGVREPEPLKRSEELTAGRRRRIFFAFLPLGILSLAADFFSLKLMALSGYSRLVSAAADTLLSLAGQFATVAGLLIYMAVADGQAKEPKSAAKRLRAV